MPNKKTEPKLEKVLFRLHPRVFAALGTGLVTNDLVAIIELVKNSYDAFASHVDVRFASDPSGRVSRIEIADDGEGMTYDLITNVWCEVATPYRTIEPFRKSGRTRRRVSGEKGLGRLSAARLGSWLEMLTQAKGEPCWQVLVDWSGLANSKSLDSCFVEVGEYTQESPFKESGTLLRIEAINSKWDKKEEFEQLEKNLSRLISPFAKLKDFSISLTTPKKDEVAARTVQIQSPDYLERPPYKLSGSVDNFGVADVHYTFALPPAHRAVAKTFQLESKQLAEAWERINKEQKKEIAKTLSGPFEFEIRAWDIGREAIERYAGRLNLGQAPNRVSKEIRTHSGVSLYRDSILVLPKSDKGRDWLGLDLRRISRLGRRLATNQIIGYVLTTAKDNPAIQDTSDRERIVENEGSAEFQEFILQIMDFLEEEREKDRTKSDHKEPPFSDLFATLRGTEAIEEIQRGIQRRLSPDKLLPLVKRHSEELSKTTDQLEQRIVYYSRLASLGNMAGAIVHEVRNHTALIDLLIKSAQAFVSDPSSNKAMLQLQEDLALGRKALEALVRIADHFAPLASRVEKGRDKEAVVERIINDVIENRQQFLSKYHIEVNPLRTYHKVAVNPGELFTVIFNLVDNAIYWLSRSDKHKRQISFQISRIAKSGRVRVEVDDSGPGVEEGYQERIFWPGVTRKRDGIGMGLTIASEIVAQYHGRMRLIEPGALRGASFAFELASSPNGK
jgi:signal transduction histidine kinase